MPRCWIVLIETVRRSWYSSSFSVCEGATTRDSPVWIPIGSMFSMLQTVMQLFSRSRTTSYSISFQPRSDSSTRTWACFVSWAPKMLVSAASSSASVSTMALPLPPRAKPMRSISGSPIFRAASRASARRWQTMLRAVSTPISASRALKRPRSSVSRMLLTGVPSTWMPASRNHSSRSRPQFSAVCPPKESATPSTPSSSATCRTRRGVTAFR